MIHKRHLQRTSRLFRRNTQLKLAIVFLAGFIFYSQYLEKMTRSGERTILIPVSSGNRYEVSGESADTRYVSDMMMLFLTYRFSYTSETVRGNFSVLLDRFFSPSEWQNWKTTLYQEADVVEGHRISSSWTYQKGSVEGKNRFRAEGVLSVKGENGGLTVERKVYEITYRIENGRFMIDTETETK